MKSKLQKIRLLQLKLSEQSMCLGYRVPLRKPLFATPESTEQNFRSRNQSKAGMLYSIYEDIYIV